MPDLSGGPILFLNPEVLTDPANPRMVDGVRMSGPRLAPPWPNPSIDMLNELCRTVGAAIVLTRTEGFGDVRHRLQSVGLKASFAADWLTDPSLPDPADSIPAWLEAHGSPTYAIVDRPGRGPVGALRMDAPEGGVLQRADVQAATAALARFAL